MSATAAALAADLARLGLRPGDTVMVHASMRRLGPVDGGAAAVVAALDAAVGVHGTWLMVLGTVPAGPGVVFDAQTSPADPEVGVLAEVMRTTPGTVVNDHPEARFAARGHEAQALLDDTPWHDYFGPGSVLERLCARGGRVLRLGADPDTVTLFHYAEYCANVADKRRVRRHSVVASPEGPKPAFVDCLDDSTGIVDWPGEDYFALITRDYLAAGRALAVGRVGDATAELLDAQDAADFAARWMTTTFNGAGSATPPTH